MKRILATLMTLIFSVTALALSPSQYSRQVIDKDVPRVQRWVGHFQTVDGLGQVQVYELYHQALPEPQENKQSGLSVQSSLQRMILLLEASQFFEKIQKADADYQAKKDKVLQTLQMLKDHLDRAQFGEDPQNLLEEWKASGPKDLQEMAKAVQDIFAQTHQLFIQIENAPDPEVSTSPASGSSDEEFQDPAEASAPGAATPAVEKAGAVDSEPAVESESTVTADHFELQRFVSYMDSADHGQVAPECQDAQVWKTDQAESCQSDESFECDRNYARQCQKVQ